MWIKWKYVDHAHPDFKEVEIPDDLDGEETVVDYICERGWVPTWSERFMTSRIKWEELKLSAEELKARKVAKLKASISYHEIHLENAKKLLQSVI